MSSVQSVASLSSFSIQFPLSRFNGCVTPVRRSLATGFDISLSLVSSVLGEVLLFVSVCALASFHHPAGMSTSRWHQRIALSRGRLSPNPLAGSSSHIYHMDRKSSEQHRSFPNISWYVEYPFYMLSVIPCPHITIVLPK